MQRRAFLAGLLATAAVPALPKVARPAFDIGEVSAMLCRRNDWAVYVRSPAMDVLPGLHGSLADKIPFAVYRGVPIFVDRLDQRGDLA